MSSWTAGYRTDIDYTYGYYTELNPLRAQLALLSNGFACPEFSTACELGFGQGISVNLHAAASPTQWYGTDFNPSQAAFAQELGRASSAGVYLFDDSFEDFCNRSDLPDFDSIGLHGIWSWISDDNRSVLVDFIRRKLKVGGVLYISYNTLPGWAAFAPMRHLMREHAEVLGAEGRGILSRMTGAIEFAEKMLATNPAFLRAIPAVGDRLEKMKGHNRHYIAHEYFNEHFYPMHFSAMAQWLDPAKLQYACSANYLDQVDALNLNADQQVFLAEIPDPMFRQSVRDFMVNQQFRKDYWIKGARKLSALEQAEALRAQRIMLVTHRSDVSLKVVGSLGEVTMKEEIYAPLLDLLADYAPRSLSQVEAALRSIGIGFPQILQSVIMLIGAGHVAPVQKQKNISASSKTASSINSILQNKARGSGEVSYLASPVIGGGMGVGRFQQLFLLAISQGGKRPEDWAQFVWQTLSLQSQRVVKDGVALETPEQNLTELTEQAKIFAEKRLPVLKALQVA
jgi:SAM-dependent methyltransferase